MLEPLVEPSGNWDAVIAVLAAVDDLPAGSTGLLAIGGAGGIFVEQNRICWAASNDPRGRLRLSERLAEHAGISPEDFRSFYERCRVAGAPIGQQMVEEGLMAPSTSPTRCSTTRQSR